MHQKGMSAAGSGEAHQAPCFDVPFPRPCHLHPHESHLPRQQLPPLFLHAPGTAMPAMQAGEHQMQLCWVSWLRVQSLFHPTHRKLDTSG